VAIWQEKGSCGSRDRSEGLEKRWCRHSGKRTKVQWGEQTLCHRVVLLEENLCAAEAIAHDLGCGPGLCRCLVEGKAIGALARLACRLPVQLDWDELGAERTAVRLQPSPCPMHRCGELQASPEMETYGFSRCLQWVDLGDRVSMKESDVDSREFHGRASTGDEDFTMSACFSQQRMRRQRTYSSESAVPRTDWSAQASARRGFWLATLRVLV
jgi:hypothetical protein